MSHVSSGPGLGQDVTTNPPKSNMGYTSLHLAPPSAPLRCDYLKQKYRGGYQELDDFRDRCSRYLELCGGSKAGFVASIIHPHFVVGQNRWSMRGEKLALFRSAAYGEAAFAVPNENTNNFPVWTEIKGQQCMWMGAETCERELTGLVDQFFARGEERLARVDWCMDFLVGALVTSLKKSVDLAWYGGKGRDPVVKGNPTEGFTIYLNGNGVKIRLYEKWKQIAFGVTPGGKRYGDPEEAANQAKQVFGTDQDCENWVRAEVEWDSSYLAGRVGMFNIRNFAECKRHIRKLMAHTFSYHQVYASPKKLNRSRNVVHPYWEGLRRYFSAGHQSEPEMRRHMPIARMNSDARIKRIHRLLAGLVEATYEGDVQEMSRASYLARVVAIAGKAFDAHDQDNDEIYRIMANIEAYRAEFGFVRQDDYQDDF